VGKVCVELRSTNHKFLEVVLHAPEGFLSWEEKAKKEIETKIKRGRLTCAIRIIGAGAAERVFVNKGLLKNYLAALKKIKEIFRIKDDVRLDTLLHLPGVLSLAESGLLRPGLWLSLKRLLLEALDELVKARQKEGRALYVYLIRRAGAMEKNLAAIRKSYKKVMRKKLTQIQTEEERAAFLKDRDITEELERLAYHLKNFTRTLSKPGPVGKELDFIVQEMQREANTMGAKCYAAAISGRVIQLKGQIEKMREQIQNIE
jgi:uncharacterized protein (TIGR00255 family)